MDTKERTTLPANEVESIDLLELWHVIWQRIWIVLIGILVGGGLAFAITKTMITPQYEATSTIYIFSKTTSITSLADLQIGSQLTEDFQIIATTRSVVESVITDLGLNDTYGSLVQRITVSNPSSSHMLRVTARDTDPERAANISNTLSDKLRDQIADIMNTDRPSTVERAVKPASQSSPSVRNNTIIGALAGALFVIAIIVIRFMTDDTIKSREDIEKYLGLDTLAEFPFIREQGKGKGKKKKSSRKKKKSHSSSGSSSSHGRFEAR